MQRTAPSRRRFLQFSCLAGGAALLPGTGCEPDQSSKRTAVAPQQPVVLRVIVVEDKELGEAIGREWHSRTESEVEIVAARQSDVADASRLPGDVVIFPSALLGRLVEGNLIRPLSESMLASETIAFHDIFPLTRRQELTWGENTYALPLGSPQFVLGCRPDLLQRLELAVPTTWDEYQAAVEKLSNRALLGDAALEEGQSWSAAAEPTGSGFAGCLLLARAAAYASHREQVTLLFDTARLEPLINQPPYVRALEELSVNFKSGRSHSVETPWAAFGELLAGRCGMALGWASHIAPSDEATRSFPIAFAELPGSQAVFNFETEAWETRTADQEQHVTFLGAAGRLAAVTASSAEPSAAEGLVGWLSGTEVSSRVAGRSRRAGFFRSSHKSELELWVGKLPSRAQYFEVVEQAQSRGQAMTTIRLPASERYLAALDEAVQRAAIHNQDPQASLDEAAEDWRKITADEGIDGQRQALLHSLGLRRD